MSRLLKVFTFNLRLEAKVDGVNDFMHRTPRVKEVIDTYAPDLIGFQEVNDNMRAWLHTALTDYTVVGCGRYADYRGESTVLAFRSDRFMMIDSETRWLSTEPLVPASRFPSDQSGCPRTYTAATLFCRGSDRPFRFYNTHLDHQGPKARFLEAMQLMQRISADKDMQFILTGDFNAEPDQPEITAFTTFTTRKVIDATAHVGATFHAFGKATYPYKIDYIFTDGQCDPYMSHAIEDKHPDGLYYSDHRPVCAYIEI